MTTIASTARQGDGRLWVIALGLSLLLNVAILGIAGFASLKSQILRKPLRPAVSAPVTTVMIFPELAAAVDDSPDEPAPPEKPRFARTSADQASPPPEKAALIGERDTTATSDRAPDATAPPLPSQAGITPKDSDDLETTESDYQDGRPADDSPPQPKQAAAESSPPTSTPDPAMAASATAAGEEIDSPGPDLVKSSPPASDPLVEGPNPVDTPVPRKLDESSEIKPSVPKNPAQGEPAPKVAADLPKPPAAKPVNDPAFSGYQRKAAIVGSISRTGRSALNVADTPLGRYQAIISRAVELEWQRNCVRHRDFITPGYLTVRFFVETSGKVRTVQFVGAMQTGEVQKGFTLSSIRDAEIPAMPPAVKKDFTKEPLELIFNFYF